MKPQEYTILKLLKEKNMLMTELQKELEFATNEIVGVMAFLENYKLVETSVSNEHELMAKITERGLHLLNLPSLPEDETTGEEITELMEQKVTDKSTPIYPPEQLIHFCSPDQLFSSHETPKQKALTLYTIDQDNETANWIVDMGIRFNVRPEDVIRAMWFIAKDSVWAKLEQDVKANHSFFAVTPPLVSAKTEGKR